MPPRAPKPGQPVRGSRSGRPVMALIDLVGRRWVLRIVWELRDGPLTFRALQNACGGISPSVLNQRLADLRETALVEVQSEQGYALTALGRELLTQLVPLTVWAEKWANAAAPPAVGPA
jgi:DNA-binding HxlR family transcriptional regulator